MTTEEKIARLETRLERERTLGIARIRITDSLGFDEYDDTEGLSLSLCPHEHNNTLHWSASIGTGRSEFTCARMVTVFEKFQPRMQMVPMIKEGGCMPVFAPEAVNCSAGKGSSEQVGEQMVELRQHGGPRFRSRQVSAWIEVPDVGWVELNLNNSTLPRDWEVCASYKSFNQQTGDPQTYEITAPRAGLPGTLRKNMGGAGSWDFTAYWDNAETFRCDVLRAGV